MTRRTIRVSVGLGAALLLSACNGGGALEGSGLSPSRIDGGGGGGEGGADVGTVKKGGDIQEGGPTDGGGAGPTGPSRVWVTDVLIFNGTGTSASDTASVEGIVAGHGLSSETVTSAQLEAKSAEDLKRYGVIVWPGGVASTQSYGLSAAARARVQAAVEFDGVGYVGFCAGAFIAGTYAGWGLGLSPEAFDYYKLEYEGYTTAMTRVDFADGTSRDLLWYGGPQVNGFGTVVGKYPDGNAAIAQDRVGQGVVILSGPHPEAPQGWRAGLYDSDGLDFDLAYLLINTAMSQEGLPSF